MDVGFQAFRESVLAAVGDEIGAALGRLRVDRVADVALVLGSQGQALAVGEHLFLRLGLNGPVRILTWSLGATVGGTATVGSVTVDLKAGATLGGLWDLCGANPPALAAVSELADQPPAADWTRDLADPLWLWASVTATDGTLEEVGLTLRVRVDAGDVDAVTTGALDAVTATSGAPVTAG